MICFEKLTIENFLSHANTSFDFTSGVHVVHGVNKDESLSESNGSGKSAMFEAIAWAIYGNTERQFVDRDGNGNTRVYLSMLVGESLVEITRYFHHDQMANKLTLSVDHEDRTCHTIKETQALISGLINMPYNHFVSSVTIVQGMSVRLSDMKPTARKDYFSSVINFDWKKLDSEATKYHMGLVQRCNGLMSESMNLLSEKDRLAGQLEALQGVIDSLEIQKYRLDVQNATEAKGNASARLSELQPDIAKYESALQQKRDDLTRRFSEVNTTISQQRMLADGTCPTCNRPYPVDGVLEAQINVREARTELGRLELVRLHLSDMDRELRAMRDEERAFRDKLIQYDMIIANANRVIDDVTRRASDFEEVKRKHDSAVLSHASIEESLSVANIKADNANQFLRMIKPSGELRSFLISSYLDLYNDVLSTMREYVFPEKEIQLKLDDDYQGVEIKGIAYDNLSGGEKRRADILMQLAFSEFVSRISGFECNLLVVDEIFDGLDIVAAMNTLTFIQEYFGGSRCLYIITHNDRIKNLGEGNLVVVKRGGVSTLISE